MVGSVLTLSSSEVPVFVTDTYNAQNSTFLEFFAKHSVYYVGPIDSALS